MTNYLEEILYLTRSLILKDRKRSDYLSKFSSFHFYSCDICKGSNQPYMLKDKLFKEVINYYQEKDTSMICLNCVEKSIDRNLRYRDFNISRINRENGLDKLRYLKEYKR
jgi:superfamily II helicase